MPQDTSALSHGELHPVTIALRALPERTFVRTTGSRRSIAFVLQVSAADPTVLSQRAPLDLALVIDRSGSMAGEPLALALQATQIIIGNLTERDRAAVIVFDDHTDILHPTVPMTLDAQAQVQAALGRVHTGGSTNMYDGWLTGCRAIASEEPDARGNTLSHCFLLTDGQANQGVTDQATITATASQLRTTAGISTSTFGLGAHYEEQLLGALAAAGGGQFHHVRSGQEIGDTFGGELATLFQVAVRRVHLEIALPAGVTAQVVSTYRQLPTADPAAPLVVDIGDLHRGETRAVVIQFQVPSVEHAVTAPIRSRIRWSDGVHDQVSAWTETTFTHATAAACDDEPFAVAARRPIGLAYAAWVRQEVVAMSYQGRTTEAAALVRAVRLRIARYAGGDQELVRAMLDLRQLQAEVTQGPLSSLSAKETYFQAQRSSRSQPDYRQPRPPTA